MLGRNSDRDFAGARDRDRKGNAVEQHALLDLDFSQGGPNNSA
jgi:hypothetical protein